MATRQQIARLAERVEQLASRHVPPEGPFEHWAVEGNEAYEFSNPDRVITFAEWRRNSRRGRRRDGSSTDTSTHSTAALPHAACQAASVTPYMGLLQTRQPSHDERRASEACPILFAAGHRGAERHGQEHSDQERSGCC